MKTILQKAFIPSRGIYVYIIGDCEPEVDGYGVHKCVRVYKTTAHPMSTFRVKYSEIIEVKGKK